ncbi:ERF family protein [Halomonas sp. McH1-25]|uniref:ERF family protein n=1 Tax=unclassified Halomonas TaxID=2609666 RepID=UPI001EF455C5|nr:MULTISPECIES: ERF family protein [unclassified Halomonas]MCG7598828.1 ERF family protein [Halomonas sp. McH1-25]MCP1340791.1 ERF family protein [Halomonas sp. FL8]MCP1362214.1 ERF family protein [Halomonas sp. BBD45]MCP1364122.1 ERF family protein [Halomonas sp. BBD48]
MTNQVATREESAIQAAPVHNDASAIIQVIERAALNPDVDIDKMERLLQMQERILAKNAESAFHKAMTQAQTKMRPVVRDASNDQTRSRYARLETIDRQVRPIYTEAGFSLSFGTADCPIQDHIRITCDVSHIEGHTKQYQVDMPLDMYGMKGNQNKTATHAHGSTMSYGRRYLTLMLFNIPMAHEDDDGNAAAQYRAVTPFQAGQIAQSIKACPEVTQKWFSEMYGDPVNVPRTKFDGLMAQLNKIIAESSNANTDS